MKNNCFTIALITLLLFFYSCKNEETMKIVYPETAKGDVVDEYFGVSVPDPYRWLEDETSEDVAKWIEEQNKITFDFLAQIPYRESLKERLTELWDYPKMGTPFTKANKIFVYRNNGLQNQSVLFVKDSEDGEERILIDPNTLSDDGTVSLASIAISPDGKYIAYSISRGGSDWNEIFIRDIETGIDLNDHIKWVKFSSVAWHNDGIFYSGYDKPEEGRELSQKNVYHKLYYHKLGQNQNNNVIVRENKDEPYRSHYGSVTSDGKYLVVYERQAGNLGFAVYVKELTNLNNPFITIIDNFTHQYSVIDNIGSKLLIRTNNNAGKYKLVEVDVNKPAIENWKEILPERKDLLRSVTLMKNRIITNYLKDAHTNIEFYDYEGKFLGELKLPALGTVSSFNSEKDSEIAWYDFTSFNYPTNVFKYSIEANKSENIFTPQIDMKSEDYIVEQVFYESKDGTKIPMFITYKKGTKLDGNNPTLLYSYGGFNISLTPSFSISRLLWLENGGVYAMANIRGGGEYGEQWHLAGTKLQKQNVFDDFIAAAEYLVNSKYTSPSKLAIQGGSNGGLLVGAVINQRPDLFKVALPAVGVMDMLRFHKFTIGYAWVTDYGSSDDSTEFHYIYKYSPLHNIKEGVEYPATLVTTADRDDRVVPAHSFKYIAELQSKHTGKNPVLIRIETQAGHGAGKPTSKLIEEAVDVWAFTMYNMGFCPIKK